MGGACAGGNRWLGGGAGWADGNDDVTGGCAVMVVVTSQGGRDGAEPANTRDWSRGRGLFRHEGVAGP